MSDTTSGIPVESLEINGVYQTYVKDIVKVLSIDNIKKVICFYNVSGTHKQWTDFKHINIVKRFY